MEYVGITQAAFNEEFGYCSLRTFQKNVSGENEGGLSLLLSFVEAGFNANWLLTGEGPMLITQLEGHSAPLDVPDFLRVQVGQAGSDQADAGFIRQRKGDINSELMEAVISGLFSWLAENQDRVRIDPSRYGALITVLYRWFAKEGVFDKADLDQIMRAAA